MDRKFEQAEVARHLRVLHEELEKDKEDPPLATVLLLQEALKKAKELGMDSPEFPRAHLLFKKYPTH